MIMKAFALSFDNNNGNNDFCTNPNTTKHVQLLASYIMGMLQQYKELPLHCIHNILKLFCNNNGDEREAFTTTEFNDNYQGC